MIEETTKGAEVTKEAREQQAAQKDGKPIMNVKVYSPFKVYYDEETYSLSGVNNTGPFDILPRHHNFITLVNACELVLHPVNGRKEQKIRISGGLMHVKADKVTVFLDI
jgi:F0F1-type ATP synthase epsilon subunit